MDIEEVRNHFKELKKHQTIYIRTEKQELLGRLHHVDIYYNFIYLDVVKDVKSNVEYTSRQMIPAEMVKLIRSLEIAEDLTSNTTPSTATPTPSDEVDAPSNCAFANLTNLELACVQNRINNAIIIDQRSEDYRKAIDDIKTEQFVGVAVEPTKYGRNFKTSLITIATAKNVYIFDVISQGKLFSDLISILESEIPRKAIHNSHLVVDHFQYIHNIRLQGIFDTFVAYSIVLKQKRSIDFVDICEQFFNIDKRYFNYVIDNSYYPYNTFKRPLKSELVKHCAKLACLTLKLQEHLQHKMLDKFYSQCLDFAQTFSKNENYAVATESMQVDKAAGFETIIGLDIKDQTL